MRILGTHIVARLIYGYLIATVAIGALLWLMELLQLLEEGFGGSMDLLVIVIRAFQAVPEGLIDLLPVITILATAAVMSGFQARSELTVMRASGVSVWKLTSLALIPGFGIALLGLSALQWATPLVQQGPERLIGASLGDSGLWHPWHGLWVRQDNEFLNVQSLHLGRIPTGIDLYEFTADGDLVRHVGAEQALIQPDGTWQLVAVEQRQFDQRGADFLTRKDEMVWDAFLTARQLELLLSPPASLPLTDLWQYVEGLKQRDQDVAEFEMVLWRRLALPLICLGMVLAAMATAAVPLKSRAVSVRLVAALVLGLGFQMVTELVSYTGLVMGWPVIPVALGPPLILALFAWWLLARAR